MTAVRRVADPVACQAIEWMVLLRSGDAGAHERSAFEGWRRADPLHEAACQRIERMLGRMDACPANAASRKALLAPAKRGRAGGSQL